MSNTFAHSKPKSPKRDTRRRLTAREQRELARIVEAVPGTTELVTHLYGGIA